MATFRSELPERLARAAALAVPWAMAPGLRDGLLLPKQLCAATATALGAAAWGLAGAPSLASGLEAPLAALAGAALIATAASIDRPGSLYGPDLAPEISLVGLASVLAAFYLGIAAARSREGAALDRALSRGSAASEALVATRLAAWLAVGAVPVAILAAVQTWFPQPMDFIFAGPHGRAMGTFGHPLGLGAYLAVAAPAALWAALSARARGERLAMGSALLLCAAGLAAAASRAAWLGAGSGCAAVLLLEGRPAARRAAFAALGLGLAGLLFVGSRSSARPAALRVAWTAFAQRPFLGWGPGSFGLLYRLLRTKADTAAEAAAIVFPHAHNDWAEVMASLGLAGTAAWVWLHGAALRRIRHAGPACAALGGVAALFIFAKFNLPALPAAFLAALLAGAAAGSAPARGGRAAALAAAGLFVASSLWSAWSAARRLPAERQDYLGRIARLEGRPRDAAVHFEAAAAAQPETIAFRLDLMNLLWDVAEPAAPAQRSALLVRARDAALEGAKARPAEPEFLRLLGMAELRRARLAGADSLPQARAALEAARLRDPLNPWTLEALDLLTQDSR